MSCIVELQAHSSIYTTPHLRPACLSDCSPRLQPDPHLPAHHNSNFASFPALVPPTTFAFQVSPKLHLPTTNKTNQQYQITIINKLRLKELTYFNYMFNLERFQEQQASLGQAALQALYLALEALYPALLQAISQNGNASTSTENASLDQQVLEWLQAYLPQAGPAVLPQGPIAQGPTQPGPTEEAPKEPESKIEEKVGAESKTGPVESEPEPVPEEAVAVSEPEPVPVVTVSVPETSEAS